jgi:glycosyltransferase involved in cell wall biosynthesis
MVSKACLVGAYQRKLEEIAARRVDLMVVTPPVWRDARGELALERAHTTGYELVAEPVRFNGNFHLHYYPGLKRHLKAFRPDIVHIDEEPYNFATFHAMRLARRSGARTLFFAWQNIARRYPPPFAQIEAWVLRHADYGLFGTAEAMEVWHAKGFTGPSAVIPQFGVDPELFTPAKAREERPFTIGFAGRFVREKGLDVLLHAAAGLAGDWRVRLAGGGPEESALERLAGELGITEQVHFQGHIPSTGMAAFYRGLDVLALPSRTLPNWKEQFGRLLIEGMACGVPVIGSDSGAIPEVVGEAGLIFPEDDVDALSALLRRLMADERLRQHLAQAGRDRVLAHFTQAKIAADTLRVYHEMVGEGA